MRLIQIFESVALCFIDNGSLLYSLKAHIKTFYRMG